ncbi:hypothetical protein D3C84_1022030 [compost metagenome]
MSVLLMRLALTVMPRKPFLYLSPFKSYDACSSAFDISSSRTVPRAVRPLRINALRSCLVCMTDDRSSIKVEKVGHLWTSGSLSP